MSDDRSKRDHANQRSIDIEDEQAVRYWSEKLGVTPDRLRVVVGKVGPLAGKVREELSR
jgi:hypothetical protein